MSQRAVAPQAQSLCFDGARAAVPVLPPDPLEVVHLEHEEGDDPEEDLRCATRPSTYRRRGAAAMGRAAQLAGRSQRGAERPRSAAPPQRR